MPVSSWGAQTISGPAVVHHKLGQRWPPVRAIVRSGQPSRMIAALSIWSGMPRSRGCAPSDGGAVSWQLPSLRALAASRIFCTLG